jgi:flagellar capping protein FliD
MVGHYTSLSGALAKLSELQLNLKPQYDSIQEYIKEYNEKYNKLNQILNIGV